MFIAAIIAATAGADVPSNESIQAQRDAWSRAYLAKEYGIQPDGGVTVMPAEQMKSYQDTKTMRDKIHADISTYGYVREANDPNNRLFNLAYIARRDLRIYANINSPGNTHLKYTVAELKLAYNYIGVPLNVVNVIGYAPYLSYIKDKGWVGAMQFFTKEGIGSCVYSENNIKLSHAAAIIPKEDARDDVNGKITTVIVKGTPETKFIYTVDWYDDKFFRQIECANDEYNEAITQGIIELAKVADAKNE